MSFCKQSPLGKTCTMSPSLKVNVSLAPIDISTPLSIISGLTSSSSSITGSSWFLTVLEIGTAESC